MPVQLDEEALGFISIIRLMAMISSNGKTSHDEICCKDMPMTWRAATLEMLI